MKRNEMETSFARYTIEGLTKLGVTPTLIDEKFEREKTLVTLFADCKSEIYFNPMRDNKCNVSMWLATKYVNVDEVKTDKRVNVAKLTARQVNIKTTDISAASKYIVAFIEAHRAATATTDSAVKSA